MIRSFQISDHQRQSRNVEKELEVIRSNYKSRKEKAHFLTGLFINGNGLQDYVVKST